MPADREIVVALIGSTADVGSESVWGIPLTQEELADLERRSNFQGDVLRVEDSIRSLPGFAAMYFDEMRGGILVVQVTGAVVGIQEELEAALPVGHLGVEVVQVAFTEQELVGFAMLVSAEWGTRFPEVVLFSVVVDTPRNGLRVEVDEADLSGIRDVVAVWGMELGVVILVAAGGAEIEAR